jgi:hypothetical protein
VNIYKIILILTLFTVSFPCFSAEQGTRNRQNNISIGKLPLILELEDPLDIERSQLIFPPDVFTSLNLPRQEYRESPFRRGQIIYFISLPYVYMYHFMILELVAKSRFSSSRTITKYQYVYMLLISAVISVFVAYDDNVAVFDSPLEQMRRKRSLEKRFDFEVHLFRF